MLLATPSGADSEQDIAVFALSRGSGVPEATRAALERVRALFEAARSDGRVVRIVETRIGLEGETRLCAVPRDAESALRLRAEVERVAAGVDLFNVAAEPCSRP